MMRPSHILLAAALMLASAPASAHRLIPNDGTHDDAENALYIDAPELSQLVLHAITPENPQLWLKFHRKPAESIDLQLGIPMIEGQADFRPALALLAPGLPEAEGLPFDVPETFGALVFESAGRTPDEFLEPFTGTTSLVLLQESMAAETDGPYYVVLYDPVGGSGKAWVAVGTREEFGVQDIFGFADTVETVRAFHEVNDEPLPWRVRVFVVISRVLGGVLSFLGFGG